MSKILEEEERLSSRNSQEPGETPKIIHANIDNIVDKTNHIKEDDIPALREESDIIDNIHDTSKVSVSESDVSEDFRKSSNTSADSLRSEGEFGLDLPEKDVNASKIKIRRT